MTAKELGEALDTIAEKAKALRDAGVVGRVHVDGISFEVWPEASPQPATVEAVDSSAGNPLDDGDTYGGFVPQRKRPIEPLPTAPTEDSDDD